MRGRAIKLSNIDSPCYDKKTHTDCPNRRIGCRQSCQAWEIYEAFKNRTGDYGIFLGKTGKPDICGNAGVLEPGEKEELVKTDTKYVS